jgi:antitoxin FitA
MAQVTVRNLEDDVIARLTQRAKGRGRSLEQEVREIINAAATPTHEEILKEMHRLRTTTPPGPPIDVVALIREGREERDSRVMSAALGRRKGRRGATPPPSPSRKGRG